MVLSIHRYFLFKCLTMVFKMGKSIRNRIHTWLKENAERDLYGLKWIRLFSFSRALSYLILRTKFTGGTSLHSLSSWSDPDDPTDIRVFIGFESVSLSPLDPPSSSLDQTHSPVSLRCRRPDCPGWRLDAFMWNTDLWITIVNKILILFYCRSNKKTHNIKKDKSFRKQQKRRLKSISYL